MGPAEYKSDIPFKHLATRFASMVPVGQHDKTTYFECLAISDYFPAIVSIAVNERGEKGYAADLERIHVFLYGEDMSRECKPGDFVMSFTKELRDHLGADRHTPFYLIPSKICVHTVEESMKDKMWKKPRTFGKHVEWVQRMIESEWNLRSAYGNGFNF